jgi:phosphatidylglycerol:prolipoprotein diacylglycerol transferase
MKNLFIITTTEHSFLYSLFYVAAILVSAGIFIFGGLRKKYPPSTWLLITLIGVLFFIIGNKLITLDAADWQPLIKGNGLPETGRSLLGGILGLIAGLQIAKRWLNFELPVLDHLAYALPIGIAITRLGCLFGGCCYGTPTTLPWAVQYGNHFQVFHLHAASMQIPETSALSLPMHPTQIYDLLFCMIICLAAFLTRKTWKASGSRFLFVLLSYAIFRFVNEFFRDSYLTGQWGETFMGLKFIQLMILFAVSIIAIVLIYRETKIRKEFVQIEEKYQINFHRELLLYLSAPLFLSLTYNQLAPFEMLTLTSFTILLLPIYFYHLYCQIITPQLRWIVPIFFLFSLLTMSQVNVDQNKKASGKGYKGWFSIQAFGSGGSFPDKHFDCNGNVTEILKRNYSTQGVGFSYHYKPTINRNLTISTNLFNNSDRSDDPNEPSYQSNAMNMMASYSGRNAGVTLGFCTGTWEAEANPIIPVIGAWIGKRDELFVESNFMTDYHLMGTPGISQIGIGSGFGHVDRSVGRAGLSVMPSIGLFGDKSYVLGGYFAGDFQIKDKYTLKPSVFVGREFGASLSLQMHLGKDRWKSKVEMRNEP